MNPTHLGLPAPRVFPSRLRALLPLIREADPSVLADTQKNPAGFARQLLSCVASPLEALHDVHDLIAPDRRAEFSDAVCREYWGLHDGFLLPPALRDRINASPPIVSDELPLIRTQIDAPVTWDDVLETHASIRLRLFGYLVPGWLDEETLPTLQLVADWALFQRAARNDLRTVAANVAPHEHLAGAVVRADARDVWLGGGRLFLSRAIFRHLGSPEAMAMAANPDSPVAGEVTVFEIRAYLAS